MSNAQNFFEQNSFEFGSPKAPVIQPDNLLTTLRFGIKNYYESYQCDIKQGFRNYTYRIVPGGDESRAVVKPGIGCTHEFLARYYCAIGYTQLFIELYIVKILDTISPAISRMPYDKRKTFIAELLNSVSIDYSSYRTIKYSVVLARMNDLFVNEAILPEEFKVPTQYQFLKSHSDCFEILQEFRNSIMHSGKRILFHYSFELLFINYIFPLVKDIISLESNVVFMNRNLHCGLNVLDELLKITLPTDYLIPARQDEIQNKLNCINHLKELGRASFQNRLFMGERGGDLLMANYANHNLELRSRAEKMAQIVKDPLGYNETFVCPCCGTKALLTSEYWTETANRKTRPHKAECLQCTYTAHLNIGEPKGFGIMSEEIFNYID